MGPAEASFQEMLELSRTGTGGHDSFAPCGMCLLLRFVCKADKGSHDARADLVRKGAFLGDRKRFLLDKALQLLGVVV